MSNAKDVQKVKKLTSILDEVKNSLLVKLIEEPDFTGKISIEINCNQGGISNTELYIKRRLEKINI
jgi:hypothetical protein